MPKTQNNSQKMKNKKNIGHCQFTANGLCRLNKKARTKSPLCLRSIKKRCKLNRQNIFTLGLKHAKTLTKEFQKQQRKKRRYSDKRINIVDQDQKIASIKKSPKPIETIDLVTPSGKKLDVIDLVTPPEISIPGKQLEVIDVTSP
jgi:hypothetical protein